MVGQGRELGDDKSVAGSNVKEAERSEGQTHHVQKLLVVGRHGAFVCVGKGVRCDVEMVE